MAFTSGHVWREGITLEEAAPLVEGMGAKEDGPDDGRPRRHPAG